MSNQMGLENTVDEWVNELKLVMSGIARVLKPTGSVWLNLSDSFSRHERYGSPPKSLLLGPEQVVLALVRDGWTVRNKIIWAKTNTMPTPVRDRLSCTWEIVYFLTRTGPLLLRPGRNPHTAQVAEAAIGNTCFAGWFAAASGVGGPTGREQLWPCPAEGPRPRWSPPGQEPR